MTPRSTASATAPTRTAATPRTCSSTSSGGSTRRSCTTAPRSRCSATCTGTTSGRDLYLRRLHAGLLRARGPPGGGRPPLLAGVHERLLAVARAAPLDLEQRGRVDQVAELAVTIVA